MQIDIRAELSLTPQVDAEIGALLADAFGADGGFDGRSYYKQRHHLRVLGREGDRLVGHIALCFRVVRAGDAIVPVIGLAEVATATDQVGKGIASALLKKTIAVAEGTQADFIILFGSHPIYEKQGFRTAQNRLTYTDITDGHSKQITSVVDPDLKVLSVTGRQWDDLAEVDLLGHIF